MFVRNEARDAWATIHGFLYQIQLTIVRWLDLAPGSILFCESGEDIDEFRQHLTGPPERLLEQVKVRRRNVTLRNPDTVAALVNFLDAAQANPSLALVFRFSTTAAIGFERGCTFPRNLAGIAAWKEATAGTLTPDEVAAFCLALRSLLQTVARPEGVSVEAFERFQAFVRSSSDERLLRDLVLPFEWATGMSETGPEADVQQRLVAAGWVAPGDAGRCALILESYVLHVLAQPGEKRLEPGGARQVLEQGPTATLATLSVAIGNLREFVERELATTRAAQDQIASQLVATNLRMATLAASVDARLATVSGLPLPAREEPPPLPRIASRRGDVSQGALRALATADWVSLTGGAGSGKTTLAAMLARTWPAGCEWIGLYGELERATTSTRLQGQLLRLACGADASCRERLASGKLMFADAIELAISQLPRDGLLVLDDLPDLARLPAAGEVVRLVAGACRRHRRKLLTTAQKPVPSETHRRDGLGFVESILPPLTTDEIIEMLREAAAPDAFCSQEAASMILGLTGGLASLTVAVVSFLKTRRWSLSERDVRALFAGVPMVGEREDAKRKLLALARESDLIALLARVSLVFSPFEREIVFAVAAVPPHIVAPGARFDELVGPWISATGASRFTTNPLLATIGSEFLSPDECRAVHLAAARHLLSRATHDLISATHTLMHLFAAGAWHDFAVFFASLALQVADPEPLRLVGWVTLIFPDEAWPAGMSLPSKLLLRASQIRVRAALGDPVDSLDASLDRLVAQAGAEHQIGVLSAQVIAAAPIGSARAGTVARRMLAASRTEAALSLENDLGELLSPATAWMSVAQVNSTADAQAILDVLDTTTDDELRGVFESGIAAPALEALTARTWASLADRDCGADEVDSALALASHLQRLGDRGNHASARIEGAKLNAWIVGFKLNRVEDALRALNAVEGVDACGRFMLDSTAAALLLDVRQYPASEARFEAALGAEAAVACPGYELSLGLAAEVAARCGHYAASRRWLRLRLRCLSGTDEEAWLETIAELGLMHWLDGNRLKARAAIGIAWHKLVVRDTLTARHREILRKLGHAVAQMNQETNYGSAVSQLGEDAFSPPGPGFFTRPNPILRDLPGPLPLWGSGKLLTDALLAERRPRWAARIASAAVSLALREGNESAAFVLCLEAASAYAGAGEFAVGMWLGIAGIKGAYAQRGLSVANVPITQANTIGTLLEGFGDDVRRTNEEQLGWYVVVPPLLDILLQSPSRDAAHELIERLSAALPSVMRSLAEPTVWVSHLESLQEAFGDGVRRDEIRRTIDQTMPSWRQFLVLIAAALADDAAIRDSAIHLAEAAQLIASRPEEWVVLGFAAVVRRFWEHVLETRSFAVRSPTLLRSTLRTSKAPTVPALADWTLGVLDAEAVPLPTDVRGFFVQLARGGRRGA